MQLYLNGGQMNMNYTLKLAFVIFIIVVIIKILTNVINLVGIDFVGFFEDVWKKFRNPK